MDSGGKKKRKIVIKKTDFEKKWNEFQNLLKDNKLDQQSIIDFDLEEISIEIFEKEKIKFRNFAIPLFRKKYPRFKIAFLDPNTINAIFKIKNLKRIIIVNKKIN